MLKNKLAFQLRTGTIFILDRVLTMEYCSGGFIDDVEYMKKNKIDLVGISKKVSQVKNFINI